MKFITRNCFHQRCTGIGRWFFMCIPMVRHTRYMREKVQILYLWRDYEYFQEHYTNSTWTLTRYAILIVPISYCSSIAVLMGEGESAN